MACPSQTRATLVALVADLPFELAMILVSRLQGELVHIRTDAQSQLELAATVFEDVGTVNGIEAASSPSAHTSPAPSERCIPCFA